MKFLLIMFVAWMPLVSFSYSFTQEFSNGVFWLEFPIKMGIQENDPVERERLINEFQDAANEWESVVGIKIWEFVEYTGNEKHIIRWTTNISGETGYNDRTTLAVTMRNFQGLIYQKVDILLNKNIDTLWQDFSSMRRKTILHELGHTVGLDHSNLNAVMAPYIGSFLYLQPDDEEGFTEAITLNEDRQVNVGISGLGGSGGGDSPGCAILPKTLNSSKDSNSPFSFFISMCLGLSLIMAGNIFSRSLNS